MLLVECKYEIRNNETKYLVNDDLNLSFLDDNESDDEFDDESDDWSDDNSNDKSDDESSDGKNA